MNNHILSTIYGNTERYYKQLYLIYRHKNVVLSTANKTFSTRCIGLSNTILVVTPIPDVYTSVGRYFKVSLFRYTCYERTLLLCARHILYSHVFDTLTSFT